MRAVIVLDFNQGKVFIYQYTDEEIADEYKDDLELYLDSKGHQISNCQWMALDKLELEIS